MIPCNSGDSVEGILSSDNAVFATYDVDGNAVTVINGGGYNDYVSINHTFTEEEVGFRISGSVSRYNSGYYSFKYNAGLTRFTDIE